jgi:hypothetical protein
MGRYKRERELIERLRTTMCQGAAQPDWQSLVAAAGKPMAMQMMQRTHPPGRPLKVIQHSLILLRITLYPDVNDSFGKFDETDHLYRAEYKLRGAVHGQNGWSTINTLMSSSLSAHYSFSTMAMDEAAFDASTIPPLLTAAWAAARAAGPWWWMLANSVVLSDRPVEMHLNDKLLRHQGDGPAMCIVTACKSRPGMVTRCARNGSCAPLASRRAISRSSIRLFAPMPLSA